MSNIFEVDDKGTRTMPLLLTLNYFALYSIVNIGEFEQINICWPENRYFQTINLLSVTKRNTLPYGLEWDEAISWVICFYLY